MLGIAGAGARLAAALAALLAAAYIQFVQGTPLLILFFLSYFGLSILGFRLRPIAAAGLSLTLYAGAFLGEIWRGCIQAVPRTQWEAADCLGAQPLRSNMRYVILPQALRIAIPPTVGFMVQLVKSTSLASIIGFVELARRADHQQLDLRALLRLPAVAAIYFAMCFPLSRQQPRGSSARASASPTAAKTGLTDDPAPPDPERASAPVVRLNDVHKSFGALKVLEGVLATYTARGIFAVDPFVSIDRDGVGELIKIGVERGRKAQPDLKIGICGEHGGDPASVAFCHEIALDYVSCSPFRAPIARLGGGASRARQGSSEQA